MHFYLFNNPQAVTQEEWEQDFLLLPSWRQQKVLEYRFLLDRVLCTKAFLLLKQGLEEHYGIRQVPEFSYGPDGKPFFREYPHIHFNLSHTRHGVLCVIADKPIGCDIEDIPDHLDPDLCQHVLSAAEIEEIQHASVPQIAFIRLWTVKEALLKLTGEGLVDDLTILLTPSVKEKVTCYTCECPEQGYVYSILYFKEMDTMRGVCSRVPSEMP